MLTTLTNIAFILVLLIPFMDTPEFFSYDTVRLPLLVTFSSVILWCILVDVIKKGEISYRRNPLSIVVILFLICNILSIFKAVNIYEAVRAIIPLSAFIWLYWFTSNGYLSRTFIIRYVVNIIVAIGFIISIYGILQKLGIDFIEWDPMAATGKKSPDAVSTLGNTNYAGGFLAILLPFTLAMCFSRRGLLSTFFYLFTTVSLAIHLVLTGSRAGWLGAVVGSLVVLILTIRFLATTGKQRVLIASSIIMFLCLLAYMSRERITTILDTSYTSNKVRLEVWNSAIKMWRDNWLLGVGCGNFQISFQPYRNSEEFVISNLDLVKYNRFNFVEDAHNSYVQTLSELGIAGLLLLVFLIYVALRRWYFFIWQFLQNDEKDKELHLRNVRPALLIGAGGGIIGFLVAGFFNSLLIFLAHSSYFWIFLGLVELIGNNRPAIRKHPTGEKALAISVCAFFASLFLIYYTFQYMSAEYYGDKGARFLSEGQYGRPRQLEEAKVILEKSRDMDFYRWKMHYNLASTYKLLGKAEDARLEYEYALSLNPNHPPAINNLANILVDVAVNATDKKLQDAEIMLKRAIDIAPSFPLSYRNLVGVYLKMGRQDKAIEMKAREDEILKHFNPLR